MNDYIILEQLRARSESAIDTLSDSYGAYCRSIAFHILQSDEDVQECLNDVFLKIWNAAENKNITDLKYYIAATTRNTALDIYNKRKVQKSIEENITIRKELEECLVVYDDSAAVTDAIVIKDTLNAFLGTLNTTERWIFMRRYWNMDSIKQIAVACGKREDAVRKILSRTRQKLKVQLEKEGIVL